MIADTSRAALAKVDRTAGQQKVMAVFERWTNITRHEISEKSGLSLQSTCGRVNELLKSGALIELDATRDGRHLLQAAPRETQADTPPVGHADAAPNSTPTGAGIRKDRLGDLSRPVEPAGVDPAAEWVKPVFDKHRISMSASDAKRYLAMNPDRASPETLAEAREVQRRGQHYIVIL